MYPLILCTCLLACSAGRAASPEPAPAPAPSRAAPAAAPLLGVIAARVSEIVAAQVDGRITRVLARSGQRVRAGDPIAEIDATLLAERLRAATAAVDAARAGVAGAGADVGDARRQVALESRTFAEGATAEEMVRIARANLSRASAAADRAAAALREAEASRAALEAQLSHTRLTAPIDGVVSIVKAQPGEVVAPGAAIARVFDPTNLMIRFQVPRDRRRDVTAGGAVELTIAGADRPLRATVTSVSTDLEPPLDFAVAEADITDAAAAHDVQIGTLGDVHLVTAD
ncbi:MAG TPA: efflux RND transporter periplasmic adaptor subunit [Kofleriaceae bacterium]|jgi:macrolide-specific efflux system membrane fusion protein